MWKWNDQHVTSMGQRKNLITSCQGLRFFLCPTLVTCWSFHFHIYFTELKIYHLSFFHNKHFWNISSVHGFAGLTVIQWSLSFGTLPLLKGHLYSGERDTFSENRVYPPFRGHLSTQTVFDHKEGWYLQVCTNHKCGSLHKLNYLT